MNLCSTETALTGQYDLTHINNLVRVLQRQQLNITMGVEEERNDPKSEIPFCLFASSCASPESDFAIITSVQGTPKDKAKEFCLGVQTSAFPLPCVL